MDGTKLFKLVIAGDGGVGKTTLTNKYMTGLFNFDTKITIGVQIFTKDLILDDMTELKLQIWDFGGEERFRMMIPSYIRGASGVLFVFSITDPKTLFHFDEWLEVLRIYDTEIPILLIGTKADLIQDRKISYKEALDFAKNRKCKEYLETSAKTGLNVEKTFLLISELMRNKRIESILNH